ncbi:MAG: Ldh family oxidoreductase [Rhodospirillales bacterium]|nr:Ldh family oxidoreductase [Rhodospirillales bacterium]
MARHASRMVRIEVLRDLMERLIAAGGCDREMQKEVANVFLEANLRAIHHQGLDYMPKFLEALKSGKIKPNGRPRIVKEGPAFALIDGDRGPGQTAGNMAAEVAVRKAREAGAAAVGVTNSSDMYMVGYFVDIIADRGCIGLLWSASPRLAHPHGGVERRLGTNPLAVAAPGGDGYNYLIDLATTALARSTVRNADYHGEPIPEGCALGPDGLPTTNAARALQGALSPLAGAKGFGLGLIVGFLSGPLVGGDVGFAMDGWYEPNPKSVGNKGHFFVAIDPAAFVGADAYRRAARDYFNALKNSKKSPGASEIRISGERVHGARRKALAEGAVPIDEVVWQNTAKLAASLGVAMPD